MGFVDLHVHSDASDGTFTPSQVVELAKNAGLDAIALTDHDTTAGVDEALEAAHHLNIEVIPGIEVSSSFGTLRKQSGHHYHKSSYCTCPDRQRYLFQYRSGF